MYQIKGHTPYLQVKALHELAWDIFPKELHRLYNNRFRYELHYKLGGDFSLPYLSSYLGKYFGILEFTDKLFKSTIPRKEIDYLQIWNDPNKHSIVMHDHYNLMEWDKRYNICSRIVGKVCAVPKSIAFQFKECIELGMEICEKERVSEKE